MSSVKSLGARFVHALGFELIALVICVPVLSWFSGASVARTGMLTLMISLLAMAWNMAFNAMFERVLQHLRLTRNLAVRAVHALMFEAGLLLVAVPLAAWWLDVSVTNALMLDLGFLLFFLPYTLLYNWAYDRVCEKLATSQSACSRST